MIKSFSSALEPPVTVKQRMGIRAGLYSLIKNFVDKRIIIAFAKRIRHDTPIIQVENGAEVELVYRNSFIPFELCYISQLFFVRFVRMELMVEDILCSILGILSPLALIPDLPDRKTICIMERERGASNGNKRTKTYSAARL